MAETASTTVDPADQAKQEAFVRIFCIVLVALTAFTIFCMMVARLLGASASLLEDDPILRADTMSRIAPVGQVRTTADADASGEAAVIVAQSGEEIVQGVCAGCHISGVAGAPKLDDEAAWAERRSLGLDALTASVINGKGAMPPRAGTDLSDDDLKRAVAHMVGLESEDAAATEDSATASEADTAAEEQTASSEETSGDDSESSGDTDAAATGDSASQSEDATSGATASASATATATAATTAATASQTDAAAEIQVAEATARVKGVADGICSACHLAGVGGAPKIGDADAWAQRAEKGLAAQVQIVAAGKGAMPARGGSDLNDEELAAAIVYLMNK